VQRIAKKHRKELKDVIPGQEIKLRNCLDRASQEYLGFLFSVINNDAKLQ